jgi:tetratricopeptide (TPR) repeat protein
MTRRLAIRSGRSPGSRGLHPALVLLPLLLGAAVDGASADTQPGRQAEHPDSGRQSLQELLARLKRMRDDRAGELRGSVEQILRAMETEAETHHLPGLAEQKGRLLALGPESAPLLVDRIDPGDKPTDAARLLAIYVTQALVEQPSPAITARLVEIARLGFPDGRVNAAKALAVSPERERAGAVLAELFRTTQGELRRVALTGIAHLGGADNEKVIAQALAGGDTEAVKLALEALAGAHAASFAPRVLKLISATHEATPYVDGFLAYYRACPEVVDKSHVLALVHLAGDLSVTNEGRGRILEFLPQFSEKFDAEVKKELHQLATSPTREVREGALVTLYLAGDKSARKELLTDYDEQIDRNKGWPASWEARGNVFYRIGEYRDAIRDYQKSLSLSAADFRARTEGSYIGLARCYAQQGKLKEAAAMLEKAPISIKELAELKKEPVFQKLAEHPKYGKVFKTE